MTNEINIRVAGENGDGIFSSGETLAKICSRSGLSVHGSRAYQSIIRRGHVSYSVRASNEEVRAPADYIDVLIALRADAFLEDAKYMMKEGGIILYDSKGSRIRNADVPEGRIVYDVPAADLAAQFSDLKILSNTVLVGAAISLYDLDLAIFKDILEHTFGDKGEEVVNINVSAAEAGYNWGKENLKPIEHSMTFSKAERVFIGGNESLAFGMLNGGLQSFAYYPMTPATPVGIWLSKYGPMSNCAVKQMEDEINVANYAVGAGYAGARSACATSGGGFALMTEAVGFASMIEAPVVFIEVARGGPSTGLPTKTEQGDLNQLLGASQGDFPRAIIAQEGVEDGFYLGHEALNIADKYQIPVLISSDLYMGEHFETVDYDFDRIPIERGQLITDEIPEEERPFKRYKLTEDGISPRTIPGVVGGDHDAGSDEHDEFGYLVSDRRVGYAEAIQVRKDQMEKRMKKMDTLLKELPAPVVDGYGPDEAQLLIIGWGSSRDTIKEARMKAEKQGIKTAQLNIKYILPFHAREVGIIIHSYKSKGVKVLMVEANYTGQMARHIRAETGFAFEHTLFKYDGEYMLPREVLSKIKEVVQ
ncbi:MAG: 2-oxoacid:acceptor oxidoreductase subunit alpha [Candidatus Heimdallarchaeota archaeon]|nr:2-oxoacid:acceptor oxidoreductase subunit alpha [Candidatus Heimdallarchaeota archaeon]